MQDIRKNQITWYCSISSIINPTDKLLFLGLHERFCFLVFNHIFINGIDHLDKICITLITQLLLHHIFSQLTCLETLLSINLPDEVSIIILLKNMKTECYCQSTAVKSSNENEIKEIFRCLTLIHYPNL